MESCERITEISQASLALPFAKRQYVSRAVSVLAYIAQLALAPQNIKQISTAAVVKILRFPGHALDYDSAHALEQLGGL